MSLKVKKFNQGATEMFISEFEIEFLECDFQNIQKLHCKKSKFQRFPGII